MGARTTIEPVTIQVIRWQVDHLGYTRCGTHIDESRGGDVHELEARDVNRSAETDDPAIWTCDVCQEHVSTWATEQRTVNCVVEHTPCRIY